MRNEHPLVMEACVLQRDIYKFGVRCYFFIFLNVPETNIIFHVIRLIIVSFILLFSATINHIYKDPC